MVNAGYPPLLGGSYSLNYRSRKTNLFSSYGLDYRDRPGTGSSYQEYNGADTSFVYVQNSDRNRKDLSHNFRIGLDYHFNDLNTLTGSFDYNTSDGLNTSTSE
jgi:hypothetical protein